MKSELLNAKPDTQCADELSVGTIFIAYDKFDDSGEQFLALKVEDINGCEYILDMDDDKVYTDVHNYYVVRTVNGKFVEEGN